MIGFKYDYVPYKHQAPGSGAEKDAFYLDVGGRFAEGVIDHHHIDLSVQTRRNLKSTARMVLMLMEYSQKEEAQGGEPWPTACDTLNRILEIRERGKREDVTITIYLHVNPDLDSLLSAFLLENFIKDRGLPPERCGKGLSRQSLAKFVDDCDSGIFPKGLENPGENPYLVLEAIKTSTPFQGTHTEYWEKVRQGFFDYLEDCLFCTGHSCSPIHQKVEEAIEKAREIVGDFWEKSVRKDMGIKIPCLVRSGDEGGKESFRVEPREIVFMELKGRIQTGFNFLKVLYRKPGGPVWVTYYPAGAGQTHHRIVLSVDGAERWALFGLGWHLEQYEREYRESRKHPQYPVRLGPFRPGYYNNDPWYDGRAREFTIVDSPSCGTILGEDLEDFFSIISIENSRWKKSLAFAFIDLLNRNPALLGDSKMRMVLRAITDFVGDHRGLKERLREIEFIMENPFKKKDEREHH